MLILSGLGRTIEQGASASSPLTGFLQDRSRRAVEMNDEQHVNESILSEEITGRSEEKQNRSYDISSGNGRYRIRNHGSGDRGNGSL